MTNAIILLSLVLANALVNIYIMSRKNFNKSIDNSKLQDALARRESDCMVKDNTIKRQIREISNHISEKEQIRKQMKLLHEEIVRINEKYTALNTPIRCKECGRYVNKGLNQCPACFSKQHMIIDFTKKV